GKHPTTVSDHSRNPLRRRGRPQMESKSYLGTGSGEGNAAERYFKMSKPADQRQPPHLLLQPALPPSSLTTRSSNIAPIVAFTMALTTPVPGCIPTRGSSQLPIQAPIL